MSNSTGANDRVFGVGRPRSDVPSFTGVARVVSHEPERWLSKSGSKVMTAPRRNWVSTRLESEVKSFE